MIINNGIKYKENNTDELVVLGFDTRIYHTAVNIPSYVDGKPVVAIAPSAFENETTLKEINLPKTIKTIGKYAFAFCEELVYFSCDSDTLHIEECAFSECVNLEVFLVADCVTLAGNYVFEYCEYIKEFNARFVGEIPIGTFRGCSHLQSFTFENIISIAYNAFAGCSRLVRLIVKHDFLYTKDFEEILEQATIQCDKNSKFIELGYEGKKVIVKKV